MPNCTKWRRKLNAANPERITRCELMDIYAVANAQFGFVLHLVAA
jgi:hypothetical protein